jgi:hypothetical protein
MGSILLAKIETPRRPATAGDAHPGPGPHATVTSLSPGPMLAAGLVFYRSSLDPVRKLA